MLDDRGNTKRYTQLCAEKARDLAKSEDTGDILVFMPGMKEIEETIRYIPKMPGVEIVQLHGSLSPKERDYVLLSKKSAGITRRIIVSTNIAETSLTVPGITMVVDSCMQRAVWYDDEAGIVRKGTELISQDQAEQRAGRAGRLAPGICYRMVTKNEYEQFDEHPHSEISRAELSHLVLRLKAMGLSPHNFPFYEQPDMEKLSDGERTLGYLGALDEEGNLTNMGRQIAELEFEPRVGRMILEAKERSCIEPMLIMAAFTRENKLFMGPTQEDWKRFGENKREANQHVATTQEVFQEDNSDWFKSLKVFLAAIERGLFRINWKSKLPHDIAAKKQFEYWCRDHYLNARALTHIAHRIRDYFRYADVPFNPGLLQAQAGISGVGDEYEEYFLQEHGASALDPSTRYNLGCSILAGYPDRVYYLTPNSSGLPEYERVPLDHRQSPVFNPAPRSALMNSYEQYVVAKESEEGRGTMSGAEIKRNYLNGCHPLTLGQIKEVYPSLIEEEWGEPQEDFSTHDPVCKVRVRLKNTYHIITHERRPATTHPQYKNDPEGFATIRDAIRLRREWALWSDRKFEQEPIIVHAAQPFPTLAELRLRPQVYATDRHGQACYAYPAIEHNWGEPGRYQVTYYKKAEDAETKTAETKERHDDWQREKASETQWEQQAQQFCGRVKKLDRRVQKLLQERTRYKITPGEELLIAEKMARAKTDARYYQELRIPLTHDLQRYEKDLQTVQTVLDVKESEFGPLFPIEKPKTERAKLPQVTEEKWSPPVSQKFNVQLLLYGIIIQTISDCVKILPRIQKAQDRDEERRQRNVETVIAQQKTLRKEFLDLARAVNEHDGRPVSLQGKVSRYRESLQSLSKKLESVVSHYNNDWVEQFVTIMTTAPNIVSNHPQTQELVSLGLPEAEVVAAAEKKIAESGHKFLNGTFSLDALMETVADELTK